MGRRMSDVSSVAWECVVNTTSGTFLAGGGVPAKLVVEACQPEGLMYGLYHLLRQF